MSQPALCSFLIANHAAHEPIVGVLVTAEMSSKNTKLRMRPSITLHRSGISRCRQSAEKLAGK